jgi:hypothetical protein
MMFFPHEQRDFFLQLFYQRIFRQWTICYEIYESCNQKRDTKKSDLLCVERLKSTSCRTRGKKTQDGEPNGGIKKFEKELKRHWMHC